MSVWIDDHPKEECGVFGIYGHPEAANMAYLGLYALQHRGQESAGIVASNGEKVHSEVGMGLVADVFTEERIAKLKGRIAIPLFNFHALFTSFKVDQTYGIPKSRNYVIQTKSNSMYVCHHSNSMCIILATTVLL